MGIEPTSSAWKAEVLPLNYTRNPLLCVFLLLNSSNTLLNCANLLIKIDFLLFNSKLIFHLDICANFFNISIYFCLYFLESPISAVSDGISTPSGGGGRIRTYVGIASRFTVCPR